jgi:hypothetical protein
VPQGVSPLSDLPPSIGPHEAGYGGRGSELPGGGVADSFKRFPR